MFMEKNEEKVNRCKKMLAPHPVEGEEEENWAVVVKWSDDENAWNEKIV